MVHGTGDRQVYNSIESKNKCRRQILAMKYLPPAMWKNPEDSGTLDLTIYPLNPAHKAITLAVA